MEEKKIQNGYICRRRFPWYSCEKRALAPFVIPYMGRNGTSNRIFRFILNTTTAVATNVYLLLYLKSEYENIANINNLLDNLWTELNSIPVDAISSGRVYAEDLHMIAPKELMNIPADGIGNILGYTPTPKQRMLF